MEARVGQLEPQRILPVNPAAHRIGGLPVTEVLQKLKHRDQRQTPWRKAGLTAGGIQRAEISILVEGGKLITQAGCHGAAGKRRAGHARSLSWDLADRFWVQAHGSPHAEETPEFADSIYVMSIPSPCPSIRLRRRNLVWGSLLSSGHF
jgi:PAS domain-containing protein